MYPIQQLQPTDQGYHTFLWRGKSQNIQHRHRACTEVVTTKVTCSKTENTVTAIDARTYRYMGTLIKFRYSEKATKFKKYIFHFVLTLLSNFKDCGVFQIFGHSHNIWTLRQIFEKRKKNCHQRGILKSKSLYFGVQ